MSDVVAGVWPSVLPDPLDRSEAAMKARMQLLAEWLLTSAAMRLQIGMPENQVGLAEVIGVSAVTISNWKKHPEFQAIMTSQVRTNVGAVHMANIIDNMVALACSDKPQAVSAAKLLMQWYQDTKPKGSDRSLTQLSDEELFAEREGASDAAAAPERG